ncbi:MAG: TIGR04168 family protein [Symploca sp. SIO2E6]|nr:TIGR04168 family protein [Symploca sp. SIO2E6]
MTSYHEQPVNIAVVGDVHNQWELEDNLALEKLGVDLVLFVGDFGNESVDVVRLVASLDLPKAVILGNHDAWYTASAWGRKKCPYDHTQEDLVQQQLDLLGETHVGYGYLDFPELNLSVVGSRPFSWGGPGWKNKAFLQERFGVSHFGESTELIVAAAAKTSQSRIIFLGHNGPFGLGDKPEDPCGQDWEPLGGDHGDQDFAEAIAKTQQNLDKTIPLVTFGHMHDKLRHTKERSREMVSYSESGIVYFNSAIVPRIQTDGQRIFSLVSLKGNVVEQISLVRVDVNQDYTVVFDKLFYSK